MSVNVERLEGNLAKMTIEISVEQIEAAKDKVFQQQKNKIQLPGFRKGKATRKMVEKMYGKAVFLEDAVNECVPEVYEAAAKESGLEIVSLPQIEYTQVDIDKPVVFTATVATRPEVTLGEYKGLHVDAEVVEVSEEDIAAELAKVQEQNSVEKEVTDRPVADGDKIKLDFEGFVDGVAFEGGKGEDYDLIIGSGSFIPGFEEQLVGAEIGAEMDVNVTFPEEYHSADLAGKPAVFKCTVKAITEKELPELNDEFASEVSEFETMEEYKNSLRAAVITRKEAEAKTEKENKLIDLVIEGAQMEIPDLMVESQAREMVDEMAQRLQYQGLSMEQYCQYTGQTVEQMIASNKETAKKRIQTRLVLEAVAAAEGVEVTEEDVAAEIKRMAEQYGMTEEQVNSYISDAEKEDMKNNLAVQKAVDVVYEASK